MDTNIISRLVRLGRVSSINIENMSARVIWSDMDDSVSDELPIVTPGCQKSKIYWMPEIDEQVVCLMLPNTSGKGSNDGFIIGSFFNEVDRPVKVGAGIRRIDFGDGSFIQHNRDTGNLDIFATGNITINGKTVSINEP